MPNFILFWSGSIFAYFGSIFGYFGSIGALNKNHMSQKVVYDAPCVETLLYAKYLRISIKTFRDLRVRTDGNNIEDLVSTEVENGNPPFDIIVGMSYG